MKTSTSVLWTTVIVTAVLVSVVSSHLASVPRAAPPVAEPPIAQHVGSVACADCHAEAFREWRSSQHSKAMNRALDETVLGNFDDAIFTDSGVTSTFFRHNGKFFVRTDGPDGELHNFPVEYTFGVFPLQQYLLALPSGRLQALGIAWDSRPQSAGGQRWFHVYPQQHLRAGSRLHWTGIDQNWNHMCADCHSTNVRKNYDPTTNSFTTTWSELQVGCEACHGPGSRHIAWARNRTDDLSRGLTVSLNERRGVRWVMSDTGTAQRSVARNTQREIEVCGQCHSRRAPIADGYAPGASLVDYYLPSMLDAELYYSDGQQHGEVYNWGSFLQSRMYARGVTCADCHEPHSQKLRARGNAICTQCHMAARYDSRAHHFHEVSSDGAQCTGCHMGEATYMVVDQRHDHSFRVPRPDQSITLGTPNVCVVCHSDRTNVWADRTLTRWYGDRPRGGFQQFAEALDSSERGISQAEAQLAALASQPEQPAIARATAVGRLANVPGATAGATIASAAGDPSPLVRRQAAAGLGGLPAGQRVALGAALLEDPARIVRIEAARVLAPMRREMFAPAQLRTLDRAIEEFRASLRISADRPEARVMSGVFESSLANIDAATEEFEVALRIDPQFSPAYFNLAEMWHTLGRDDRAEASLRRGITASPQKASLHHALGLTLVRLQRRADALIELGHAARLAPLDARFAYVYAVALNSLGESEQALREIERALAIHRNSRDLLLAAATFSRDRHDIASARRYARRLAAAYPNDTAATRLVAELSEP